MITDDRLLVVIAGPTAVGKSDLAISLAQRLGSEVISADSRQFYREMRIGTAVPSAEQLSLVPHHFIQHLSIRDPYNVSIYEQQVLDLLSRLFTTHHTILLCGGSGLYIDAVCRGLDPLPDPDAGYREQLKTLLNQEGVEALAAELDRLDPEHARTVDRKNPVRLIRALEICRMTGSTVTHSRPGNLKERPFDIMKFGIGLPREALYRKIDARVDTMMADGWLEEAQELLPFRHLNALNTVGYKELFSYMDGSIALEETVEKIKVRTRRYAKRQMTWFRGDQEYTWTGPDEVDTILDRIRSRQSGRT